MTTPPRRLAGIVLAAGVAVAVIVLVVVLASGGGSKPKPAPPTIATRPSPPATTTPGPPATPPPPTPPATAPPPGPPAKPAPRQQQLGISVNRLFNDRTYSAAQIDRLLAVLQQTGATVARSDALWEATEPVAPSGGSPSYHWSFDDQIAGSLAAHGLRWLPILDYSAPWTQSVPGQDHSAPRDPSAFAAWAAALAARYGAGGAFWRVHPGLRAMPVDTYEVWNEPDNREFWVPRPNAAYYANLYLGTRDGIAAADPTARVIVGGLTNPAGFLRAMFRARPDIVGHLDGVAIHPYGANPFVVLARVRRARRVLDSLHSPGVPLYITEFGWTTSPPGSLSYAPAGARPGYISATVATLGHTDCGIAATILYTWVTPERYPADHEDWFGIEPPAGGPSPDVAAFTAGLAKAVAPGRTVPLCGH